MRVHKLPIERTNKRVPVEGTRTMTGPQRHHRTAAESLIGCAWSLSDLRHVFGRTGLVATSILVSSVALGQPATEEPASQPEAPPADQPNEAPKETVAEPVPPPPPAEPNPQPAPEVPSAASAPPSETSSTPMPQPKASGDSNAKRPRRLAPTFPEDRYPGDSEEGGVDLELPSSQGPRKLKLAIHGYFRAPLRFSRTPRKEGEIGQDEADVNYRTPLLIDDDYYLSGFSYLPINERPWNETYLSVGNEAWSAHVGIMSQQFSDSEEVLTTDQLGVSQAWLAYRFKPLDGLSVNVKGGSFWDRFGHLPKYDTYIFGRTHQVGGQARVQFETGPWTFWVLDGVGAHKENISSKQGFTMVHYAHAGGNWNGIAEVGAYYLNASAQDKRSLQDLQDASLGVLGFDVRAATPYGKLMLAYSSVSADKVLFLAPALEVMHSYGRHIMDNYLGSEAKTNKGTGGLSNIAFQYDVSLRDVVTAGDSTAPSPLPWGGDINASVFGVLTKVSSDQKSSDPLENKDGINMWKWGAEGGWRATDWLGVSLRYDRVVRDTEDSASSFRVVSPRISLFTHMLGSEQIFLQYSKYTYKERVKLRAGQEANVSEPDEKVFKLQAQISY